MELEKIEPKDKALSGKIIKLQNTLDNLTKNLSEKKIDKLFSKKLSLITDLISSLVDLENLERIEKNYNRKKHG